MPQCGNSYATETLSWWQASWLSANRSKSLGPMVSRGACSLVDVMDLQGTQRITASDDGARATAPVAQDNDRVIETSIPTRLDNLSWSGFHTRVVLALGITWILDGLEVTLAGALSGALKESPTLQFSNFDVGLANSAYLAGAVLGALGFGWLTDRIGRKKLFFITLALYLTATAATALSWGVASYALFRFLTGAGIGGEYTAINSTIQELVPARVRGWTDLVINGSFWVGAAIGAAASLVLLDASIIDPDLGWRLAFLIGAMLAFVIFFMRLWLPESPRWLMISFPYLVSGVLLAATGYLFMRGLVTAETQTIAWMVIFFFASAAASSAYLTVSETFPLEIRALAIAFFYAVGTGIGGIAGPILFGALIDTGSRASLVGGYLLGAVLMVLAAGVMGRWGIAAERRALESVARPLAFVE